MAEPFGGVEFPGGAASFADRVVSYEPGEVAPNQPDFRDSATSLGAPDCVVPAVPGCWVSLGDGGRLTLELLDNRLRGDGTSAADLYIFEIGSSVEAMFVEVSSDGQSFTPIGRVAGQPTGVNIDSFGFGPTASLAFVRITDDPDAGEQAGVDVGADIDAVGAISSQPATTTTAAPTSSISTVASTTSTTAVATTTTAVATSTTVAATTASTTSSSLPRTGTGVRTPLLLAMLSLGVDMLAVGRRMLLRDGG